MTERTYNPRGNTASVLDQAPPEEAPAEVKKPARRRVLPKVWDYAAIGFILVVAIAYHWIRRH